MTSVAPHSHPELEDRVTAEMTVIRTELDQLRAYLGSRLARLETEMNVGFASIERTLRTHGDMLRQVIEQLGHRDGGGDAPT